MAKWYITNTKRPEVGICKTCNLKVEIKSIKANYKDKCPRCGRSKDGMFSKAEKESRDRLGGG